MSIFKNLSKYFILTSLSFLILFSSVHSTPLKISILQVIEHPALDATRKGFLDELDKLGYKEGKNLTLEYQSAQGNTALATQIAQKFISQQPNLIIALGTTAAQAAMAAAKGTETRVVFISVTDPLTAKLVANLKKPEGYVTGVSNFIDPQLQFALFKKLLPKLKTLGVVYNSGEPNSKALLNAMKKAAKNFHFTLVEAPASKTADVFDAAQSLCSKKAEAIFINNDNTALSAFKSVIKAAKSCDLPIFVSDVDLFDQGARAALGPNQVELGRQAARMADFMLKNPKAPLPSVEFPHKTEEHIH